MNETIIHSRDELEALLKQTHPDPAQHLGEILTRTRKLGQRKLEEALEQQKHQPGRHLGDILVEMDAVSADEVKAALAQKLGIPSVRLSGFDIEPGVLDLIPADLALSHSLLPLAEINGRLIVAMENPLDWEVLEQLRFNTGYSIDAVHTSSMEISHALNTYYSSHSEVELRDIVDNLELSPAQAAESGDEQNLVQQIAQEAQKRPIVRLVNAVIMQGILHRASDINIRPEKERVNIYYRIDGRLQLGRSLSRTLLPAIVSRIKITGHMNIAERRLPQDGHSRLIHEGKGVDLRISVIPTVDGESVVIRILDSSSGLRSISQLGLDEHERSLLKRLYSRNNGILLVTGPTGSGKSTTLYAMLNELHKREPHIITVEDPVEYAIQGVEQIQIKPQTGYTFAEALRHILRHDPDIIMVGEIRDLETAQIAAKAALTGHLVLSTLHTNDAASSVTRLVNMGLEPYLVSATVLGVMAQRLVRLNCPHCLGEEPVDLEIRQTLQVDEDETFQRGTGCEHCNHTGYHGRRVVSELLEVNSEIAELINSGATTHAIREAALRNGMRSLTQNALQLAREGSTSLEEVFNVRLE